MNSWQQRPRMAVQNAVIRAGILEDSPGEEAQLRIDGRERRDGVTFAENEQVLAAARRVGEIGNYEAAIIQRDQRNHGGEGSARVQTAVHGPAALLQRRDPDVRILD